MKTLYIECNMGAAGDMLSAALSELVDQKEYVEKMNALGLEGLHVEVEESIKCGIKGTHMKVLIDGEEEMDHHHHDEEHHSIGDHEDHHHHSHPSDITKIIDGLNVSNEVKKNAKEVYQLIAEAESHVHNMPVKEIHYHEVGTKDAIADVVGVCLLMEMIHPDCVLVSPVATGSGTVHCAHGILPVPAPAVAYLLQGIPSYAGNEKSELLTPTGAALLKYFADSFETQPVMKTEKVGYGMGKKDFHTANCVRVFLGETEENGEVVELVCNIDDMTPEEIAFANEQLMAEGALDVYSIATVTKKGRPGWLFTTMCKQADKEKMIGLVFKYTTTLGIRENVSRRYTLTKSFETIDTEFGSVRLKTSKGWHTTTEKYEYEDLAKIARERNLSLAEVKKKINK